MTFPTGPLLRTVRKHVLAEVPALKDRVYIRMAPADAQQSGSIRCLLTAVQALVESPLQQTWVARLDAVLTSDKDSLAEANAQDVFAVLVDSGSQDSGRHTLPRDTEFDIKTVTPVAVTDPRPPREKGKRLFEYGLQFQVEMEAR